MPVAQTALASQPLRQVGAALQSVHASLASNLFAPHVQVHVAAVWLPSYVAAEGTPVQAVQVRAPSAVPPVVKSWAQPVESAEPASASPPLYPSVWVHVFWALAAALVPVVQAVVASQPFPAQVCAQAVHVPDASNWSVGHVQVHVAALVTVWLASYVAVSGLPVQAVHTRLAPLVSPGV